MVGRLLVGRGDVTVGMGMACARSMEGIALVSEGDAILLSRSQSKLW